MPLRGLRTLPLDMDLAEMTQIAQKTKQAIFPVLHPTDKRLVGYYESSDLLSNHPSPRLRPVVTFDEGTGQIAVLNKMVSQHSKLSRIVNSSGALVGIVLRDRLISQMLQRI
jgi:predicted transcriptional regulator